MAQLVNILKNSHVFGGFGVKLTMKYISLLGATGSIGIQTVDIILNHKEEFSLVAMSVGKNIDLARKIMSDLSRELVSTMEKGDADIIRTDFPHISFTYGDN